MKREVIIQETPDSWLVRYVTRAKRQHYLAAQFDKGMRNRAEVEAWVNANPKLKLVEPEVF